MECGESTARLACPSGLFQLQRSRTRWSAERTRPEVPRVRGPGFNGAALVGVRRETVGGSPKSQAVLASTEPHSLECGEAGRGAEVKALTKLQRSRTRWSAESKGISLDVDGAESASTEPHSLECGEKAPALPSTSLSSRLQRSRTRWSAERILIGFSHLQRRRASTEPHSLECGE